MAARPPCGHHRRHRRGHPLPRHLTVRGTIRIGAGSHLHEAAEMWAHVELASTHTTETAEQTRAVLRRGLENLRLELDTTH